MIHLKCIVELKLLNSNGACPPVIRLYDPAQATPNGDSATRWGQIEQALAKRHGQDDHRDIAGSTDLGSRLVELKEGQERSGNDRRGVLVTDQKVSCRRSHHGRHRPNHL